MLYKWEPLRGLQAGCAFCSAGLAVPRCPNFHHTVRLWSCFAGAGVLPNRLVRESDLYKKSLTESWGPRQVDTSLSISLGSGLMGTSGLSGHPPDTWQTPVVFSLARVLGALPGSTFISRHTRGLHNKE